MQHHAHGPPQAFCMAEDITDNLPVRKRPAMWLVNSPPSTMLAQNTK